MIAGHIRTKAQKLWLKKVRAERRALREQRVEKSPLKRRMARISLKGYDKIIALMARAAD